MAQNVWAFNFGAFNISEIGFFGIGSTSVDIEKLSCNLNLPIHVFFIAHITSIDFHYVSEKLIFFIKH
jgi:hypothetical protein